MLLAFWRALNRSLNTTQNNIRSTTKLYVKWLNHWLNIRGLSWYLGWFFSGCSPPVLLLCGMPFFSVWDGSEYLSKYLLASEICKAYFWWSYESRLEISVCIIGIHLASLVPFLRLILRANCSSLSYPIFVTADAWVGPKYAYIWRINALMC